MDLHSSAVITLVMLAVYFRIWMIYVHLWGTPGFISQAGIFYTPV